MDTFYCCILRYEQPVKEFCTKVRATIYAWKKRNISINIKESPQKFAIELKLLG